MRNFLSAGFDRWREAKIARVALGKYIILLASILHVAWAAMLCVSPVSAGATPLHILVAVFGGRYRAAVILLFVAALAMVYPFLNHVPTNLVMATLLIPQQVVLLMSAGAGVYAISVERYADGVARTWTFIATDQLPIILLALLYTVVVLEASVE